MEEANEFDPAPLDRIHGIGGADLVGKMAEIFFRNGPERTAAAHRGAEEKDLEAIERAVHSLKSSAGNMGARSLQILCQETETLAEAGTWDGIPERLDRLDATFEAAEAWVRNRIGELSA